MGYQSQGGGSERTEIDHDGHEIAVRGLRSGKKTVGTMEAREVIFAPGATLTLSRYHCPGALPSPSGPAHDGLHRARLQRSIGHD